MGMDSIRSRNKHQWLFVLFLFVCLWTFLNPAYAPGKARNNCLWYTETDKNTIYLLGSLHVLRGDSFPLSKEIEAAYSDCTKVVFETNPEGVNDPAFQAQVMAQGLYAEGQTLKRNVSQQTYGLFEKKAHAVGLPVAQFDRFKPWVCALLLTSMELQRLGFDPRHGIDAHFFQRAKRDGKGIIALESAEYQLGLFAKMGETEQESFLRQTLKDLELIETMASEMVDAWRTGDGDKLSSIIRANFEEHPDMYKRFITERNAKWASQIEGLMGQDDNVLVIVGTGHLVGADGIVELLRKKGHAVVQR
jgi:uncharacterized protein YbaP (TraB family)